LIFLKKAILNERKMKEKSDNANLIQNINPTETKKQQDNQWQECETVFRSFFRRVNNDNFESAYSLFDEHLKKLNYFSVNNLKKFKQGYVKKDLEIWELIRKFIDNSKFVARCEFDFKLRYINKID
jgi:hypothetical protein